MQDSHLLACAETRLFPVPGQAACSQAGASSALTERADGLCGQFKFRLSSSPLRRKCMPLKTGPGSAADIWDAGRALPSARYWLDFCIFSQVTILCCRTV